VVVPQGVQVQVLLSAPTSFEGLRWVQSIDSHEDFAFCVFVPELGLIISKLIKSVQEQRPHQQRVTGTEMAHMIRMVLAQLLDSFCRKPTQPVTARQDSQCAVGLVAVVEMQPDGEHLFEEVARRLNVRDAILDAQITFKELAR
jgi:hypothetical protein